MREREENHPRNSDAVIFRSTKWQMAMQKTVQCFEGERNELRRSFLVRERKRERDREGERERVKERERKREGERE